MLSISMTILWIPATTLFLGKKNTGLWPRINQRNILYCKLSIVNLISNITWSSVKGFGIACHSCIPQTWEFKGGRRLFILNFIGKTNLDKRKLIQTINSKKHKTPTRDSCFFSLLRSWWATGLGDQAGKYDGWIWTSQVIWYQGTLQYLSFLSCKLYPRREVSQKWWSEKKI